VSGGLRLVADAVVTADDRGTVHRPGAVDISAGRITQVGDPGAALPRGFRARQVGGLLMPGLVNTHAHTPMTLLRSAGDGLALDRWLQDVIWPREGMLEPEDIYWGMALGASELLENGVTTTCEMYFGDGALVAGARDAGIRLVTTPGIFNLPGGGHRRSWQWFLESARALHRDHHDPEGGVTVGLGPHSAYALPVEGLEACADAARASDALLHLHVAETAGEDAAVRQAHGCGIPELLERLGVLECRVLAAHSVWMDDADLDRWAEHDVAVSHCPGSNGKLGSGIAPLAALLARGVRVGLGTDGPASHDHLDLFEEMRLAAALARATAGDPAAVTTAQALHLATAGGGAALGLPVGTLAAGAAADIVRLELDDSRLAPGSSAAELMAHVVWAGTPRLVTDVWVGGRPVVVGGSCTGVDVPAALRQVRRRSARLVAAAR